MSASHPSTAGFRRFDLHSDLVRGIDAAGFDEPRPIQAETLPAGLAGRDVLGLAQTGTGKTAAFALPLLNRILAGTGNGRPRALVIAPTRELATQIVGEIQNLGRFTRVRTVTIYGGVSAHRQVEALRRGGEIVVGCPGRILDLLQQGKLRLDGVETLVLDEADHMFDMGFLPDIRRILAALPKRRQNLLFSATMPRQIRGLADDLLTDPHVAELADDAPAETIEHALYPVGERDKRRLLEHMLARDECETAIVFTRTKHRAKRLARQLSKAGHRAVELQGNMSQNQRDRAMEGFRSRRFDILVATDIASRGIDVCDVSHVINYDVPNTPEAYTHRIGRTGRSQQEGVACTFITSGDRDWIRSTERMIGESIPRNRVPGFDLDPADASSGNNGRGRRGRGNGRGASRGDGRNGRRGKRGQRQRRSSRGGGRGGNRGSRDQSRTERPGS